MKKTLSVIVALIIVALFAMPAFAAPSPTASKEYKIVVHNNNGGTGTYTTKVDKDGKHATITAHPKNGYEFVKWTTKGKYDIDDGDLTSKKLIITLNSDVEFTPIFKKIGGKTSSTPSVSINESPVSPKTGDNSFYFLIAGIGVLFAAFCAVGVKLVVSKK